MLQNLFMYAGISPSNSTNPNMEDCILWYYKASYELNESTLSFLTWDTRVKQVKLASEDLLWSPEYFWHTRA